MPRRLRIEMPGGVYHVTNRGVDRTDIVRDDTDREKWYRNAPRDAAIWLCRELTIHSLDEIAAPFGGVTRSAVTDAVRRCDRRMAASESYRKLCMAARRLVTNSAQGSGSGVRISEIVVASVGSGEVEGGNF